MRDILKRFLSGKFGNVFENDTERDIRIYAELDAKKCQQYKDADQAIGRPADAELQTRFSSAMWSAHTPMPVKTLVYLMSLEPDLPNRKINMAYAGANDYDALEVCLLRRAPGALSFFLSHGAEIKPQHMDLLAQAQGMAGEEFEKMADVMKATMEKRGQDFDAMMATAKASRKTVPSASTLKV